MALRNLVTKMRTRAAAALRLPPPTPRASLPPAGTRRLLSMFARDSQMELAAAYFVNLHPPNLNSRYLEGSHPDDVRKLYLRKLDHYNFVIEEQKAIRLRMKIIEWEGKILKVSFVILVPVGLVSALVRQILL